MRLITLSQHNIKLRGDEAIQRRRDRADGWGAAIIAVCPVWKRAEEEQRRRDEEFLYTEAVRVALVEVEGRRPKAG